MKSTLQLAKLPHKAAEPQPKRQLEPAVTGETACPTKNRRGVQGNQDVVVQAQPNS
jgi:hypothetical protein